MSPRPRSRKIMRGLLAGLGALAISAPGLACGGGDDDSAATSEAATTTATETAAAGAGAVEAFDFGFEPNTTTIAFGDSIEWENTGETLHNVKGKGFFSDG